MLTLQEIEMLAALLARAGVTQYEAIWANSILNRLRAAALEQAKIEEVKSEPTGTAHSDTG